MDAKEIDALFGNRLDAALAAVPRGGDGDRGGDHLLSCLELGDRFAASWWVRALAATGQMAFTWYVAHILARLGTVLALGLTGQTSLATALANGDGLFRRDGF